MTWQQNRVATKQNNHPPRTGLRCVLAVLPPPPHVHQGHYSAPTMILHDLEPNSNILSTESNIEVVRRCKTHANQP